MNRIPLLLSICLASGALMVGYRMSRKPAGSAQAKVLIPYDKVSSSSLQEYCRDQNKSDADYLTLEVKGCPPKAPADLIDQIETVVDFRNCSGKALIARPRP